MSSAVVERRLRILTLWALASSLGLLILTVAAFRPAQIPEVLRVERLEIVEADGRPSLIVANSQRLPGPIFGGEELPPELSSGRIGSAGMLFYGSRGDEVGGLTYRVEEHADGTHSAFGGLMFDQYRQDQVVGIQYLDGADGRSAGLRVWDRSPEVAIEDLIDLLVARRREGPEGEEARRRLQEAAARGDLGARRVFVGSEDRVASVVLHDTAGRPRLRLAVDADDTPSLEFLDEAGEVVLRLPE